MSLLRGLARPLFASTSSIRPCSRVSINTLSRSMCPTAFASTARPSLARSSASSPVNYPRTPTVSSRPSVLSTSTAPLGSSAQQTRCYTMPKGARKFYAKSPLSRKGAKTSRRNSAKKAKLRSKRRRQIN